MTRWICDDNQLKDLVSRGLIKDPALVAEYSQQASAKKSKYNNERVTIDGHTFDSKAEAREYEQLKLLKRAGAIKSIELQPKFLLQPGYERNGKKVRAIYYIADFRVITADDKEIVIDVKSEITEKNKVYRLKRSMLLYRYPDLDFREVK